MLFVEGGSSDYVVNTNDVQSCVEFLGIAAGGLCRGAITNSTAVAAGRRGGTSVTGAAGKYAGQQRDHGEGAH